MASSNWNDTDRQAAFQSVVKRAVKDKDFRALCLQDPAKAVKDAAGKDLPGGYKVRFVENAGADITFVLPDPVKKGGELSDAELEQVAGGRCAASCVVSCAISSTATIGVPGVGGVACA